MVFTRTCRMLRLRGGYTSASVVQNSGVIRCLTSCYSVVMGRPNHVLPLGRYYKHSGRSSTASGECVGPTVYKILARNKSSDISSLFVPIPVKVVSTNPDDINVGEELANKLKKDDILKILNQFYKRPEIRRVSEENNIDNRIFHQAFISFRRYCLESDNLPVDLHIVFSDILQNAANPDDILPYFLQHARQIFPHLSCMEDLKKISDLRLPANWYPEARATTRKIVFHAGPTNSGKTYHALERFISAKSGVYCGPLKLLAVEVHAKTNLMGTPCDLVTGEERQYANPDKSAASHVACTVEMTSLTTPYEVAVIDEIQMIKDQGRGWAWTRALLGVGAEEIHICGEASAMELVKELCLQIGEEVEVRNYERLTKLTIEDQALEKLENVKPGDCIVCFSKNDIYSVSRQIENQGHECAVIYGGLPPGTKLAQTNKFNDPKDPCKILVATDAIGMGLNLSIRRIIFYSLHKPTINERGEREIETLSPSQALQIGGRAGRYGTHFPEGYVTTFRKEDLKTLRAIMERSIDPIKAAGLHPTADQIELFAYHLPQATLSNLIDIFVSISQVDDSRYFMCNVENFKFLADMIQHVPLPLRARYVFCCAPINKKMPFICTMFLKFARQYSKNEAINYDWLCRNTGWPFDPPYTIVDLMHLEAVFDVLDLHLWLSYRFPDLFLDLDLVRDMQLELDAIIQEGVLKITQLLRNTETSQSSEHDDNGVHVRANKRFPPENMRKAKPKSDHAEYELDHKDEQDELVVEPTETELPPTAAETRVSLGHGKLTEQLLARGLLTPAMVKQLRKELAQQQQDSIETTNKTTKKVKKITKRSKKK